MRGNRSAKLLAQQLREIGLEDAIEVGVVGQIAQQQIVINRHLGVGQQHPTLGCAQAGLARAPPGDLVVGGQKFNGAIEPALALEPLQQALLAIEQVTRTVVGNVERLRLVVVIGQHQQADFVGHRSQHIVALLECQVTGLNHAAEQDLDIDLMVRAIDTGRVVDGVAVDQAALLRKLDAPVLRAAQVTAFDHHLAAQLVAVDTESITGLVAHLGMALKAGLDVGADAAVVEQIDRRQQDGPQQFHRCQLRDRYAQCGARLVAQSDRFGAARVNAAAFGNQALVVVVPT